MGKVEKLKSEEREMNQQHPGPLQQEELS